MKEGRKGRKSSSAGSVKFWGKSLASSKRSFNTKITHRRLPHSQKLYTLVPPCSVINSHCPERAWSWLRSWGTHIWRDCQLIVLLVTGALLKEIWVTYLHGCQRDSCSCVESKAIKSSLHGQKSKGLGTREGGKKPDG